jgi:hypothetical protein
MNFARLFAEAVTDAVRDHASQNREMRAGHYLICLGKGRPWIAARIVGPLDHEPGNPDNLLDRSPLCLPLVADILGDDCDPLDVWCAWRREETTEADYRFRCADAGWSRQHAPSEPQAQPKRQIDLFTAPPPF